MVLATSILYKALFILPVVLAFAFSAPGETNRMHVRKYIRRLHWYSLVPEYTCYLFVVIILVIIGTFLLQWTIYPEEARSTSILLSVPIPFILLSGFLFRKARQNLHNQYWRWILFIMLIPPGLLSVLGLSVVADIFYINLKLSRAGADEIKAQFSKDVPEGSERVKSPVVSPDLSSRLRAITLVWWALFVTNAVIMIGAGIFSTEIQDWLLQGDIGALEGDEVGLIRKVIYAVSLLECIIGVVIRKVKIKKMVFLSEESLINSYRVTVLITTAIAASLIYNGIALYVMGLEEDIYFLGAASMLLMWYFRPRSSDIIYVVNRSERYSTRKAYLMGGAVFLIFLILFVLYIAVPVASIGGLKVYFKVLAGNDMSACEDFLELMRDSSEEERARLKPLGFVLLDKLRSRPLNEPPERRLERLLIEVKIREAIGDSIGAAGTYHNIGVEYEGLKKPLTAIEYYNKSAAVYKKLGRNDEMINERFDIAKVYRYYLKDNDTAEKIYLDILGYGREKNDLMTWSRVLKTLSVFYQYDSPSRESYEDVSRELREVSERLIAVTEKKMKAAISEGDIKGLFDSVQTLAFSSIDLDKPSVAIDYYNRAFRIMEAMPYKSTDVNRKMAKIQHLIGMTYAVHFKDKDAEALDAYKKALSIYQGISDEYGIKSVNQSIEELKKKKHTKVTRRGFSKKAGKYPERPYDRTMNFSPAPAGRDSLEVIYTKPESPASIKAGRDELKVSIRYGVKDSDEVLIFMRPLETQRDVTYVTDGCYGHARGSGEVMKTLRLEAPQRIDTIIVEMRDRKTRRVLARIEYPVDIEWH